MNRFLQLARGWDAEALRLYPLPSNASVAPGALLSPRIALYSAVAPSLGVPYSALLLVAPVYLVWTSVRKLSDETYVLPSRIPSLCTRSTRAGIEWCWLPHRA